MIQASTASHCYHSLGLPEGPHTTRDVKRPEPHMKQLKCPSWIPYEEEKYRN